MKIKKEEAIIGYKVFDADWKCNNFQFKVGGTFTHKGHVSMCTSGFHFCENLQDCFQYYNIS